MERASKDSALKRYQVKVVKRKKRTRIALKDDCAVETYKNSGNKVQVDSIV